MSAAKHVSWRVEEGFAHTAVELAVVSPRMYRHDPTDLVETGSCSLLDNVSHNMEHLRYWAAQATAAMFLGLEGIHDSGV